MIITLNPLAVSKNPQHHHVEVPRTEPHYPSAKRPTNNTRIRDEKHCFLPDSVFIWRGRESVFIQGQALVSVISRPCCGGNAYYVVARGPCLLWPWGLFPWRNGARRNETSDHRNRPGKEKKWSKHCQTVHFLSHTLVKPIQTLSKCHRSLTHITLCLHLSGYVLILFPFSFLSSHLNSVFSTAKPQDFCLLSLCMLPRSIIKPRELMQAIPSVV